MKKYLLFIFSLVIFSVSFGFSVVKNPTIQASKLFLPVGNSGEKISLIEMSTISIKDYQKLSGKHLNFFERLSFKATQKKIKKNINADGTIKPEILGKNLFGNSDVPFNIGGFLLGLFLFLPGVLIAYLLGGDEDVKRSRTRSAWRGALLCATIVLGILLKSGL